LLHFSLARFWLTARSLALAILWMYRTDSGPDSLR